MKKISVIMLCGMSLLVSANCFAEENSFHYRFADAREAADMLLANREYYENMSQEDLNYRLQKLDATLEELEATVPEQTLDFTDKEKAAIEEGMDTIARICDERGYHLPEEGEIVFGKMSMDTECDAAAFTHGTEIYLGEEFLSMDTAEDNNDLFHEVLAHELFHCLTRNNPDFRKDMYGILGFATADEDYAFPQEVKDIIISNPDVEHHDSSTVFMIHGEEKECTVIFTTTKPFEEKGDSFFYNSMTGLVPVDDLSTVYSSEEADNFWEVFGENTDYVIDPEETLADNFCYTIIHGVDGKDYKTPEIIEKIDAYLREPEKSTQG